MKCRSRLESRGNENRHRPARFSTDSAPLLRVVAWTAVACLGALVSGCGSQAPSGPAAGDLRPGSLEARYALDIYPILADKCADCHHSEVDPPWYASLPVIGDRVLRDVEWGRQRLDFAAPPPWNQDGPVGARGYLIGLRTALLDDTMPPLEYLLTHPLGTLSESERSALLAWTEDAIGALDEIDDSLPVDQKVAALLADRCARCHQQGVADEMNGGFDFVTELNFLAFDEDYIEREDAEASPLFEHLVGDDDPMPPSPQDRLSEEEIEWVREWIDEGALTSE